MASTLKCFRCLCNHKKYFARSSSFRRCMIKDKTFENKKKIFPFGCCLSLCLGNYHICEENVNIYLCQGTGVRRQDKKYHSSFTSVEDLFAGEFKQFLGCAKTLGRDLQISEANNTQVTHSLKQSTI